MITLELFCGTKSFSKVAKELGHDTFTVDIDPKLEPDLVCDILHFKLKMLPEKFRKPDVLWASPPCTTFSVASIRHYWKDGKPKNDKCLKGIEIAKKTLSIINEIKPTYWFVENPRGMLGKQDFMPNDKKRLITYCQYGLLDGSYKYNEPNGKNKYNMKPTNIWTNCDKWISRPACKPRDKCHQSAPRGTRQGVQALPKALLRGIIPPALFYEIFDSIK